MRKHDWPVQIDNHLPTVFVIICGNYNIKDLSIMCACVHNNSHNIFSVSIKKGYTINIEHDIGKLKVVSERLFV